MENNNAYTIAVHQNNIPNKKIKHMVSKLTELQTEIISGESNNFERHITAVDAYKFRRGLKEFDRMLNIFMPPDTERDLEFENKYLRRRVRNLEKKLKAVGNGN